MDLKQIAEIVKSFNFTFDGTFNSDTLREVVEIVAPYYKWYLIKGCVLTIIGISMGTLCVYWIAKALREYWKNENK